MSEQEHRPPYPGTRLRPVRVEDELWDEGKNVTAAQGTSNSAVMRAALRRYIRRHGGGKHDGK